MAKKYLTIEDAAEQLGMSLDELTRIRELGELRGFADRGTWKFKAEDIEEFARSRQVDSEIDSSDDDVLPVGEFPDDSLGSTSILDDEDEVAADQPTLVRGSDDEVNLADELLADDTSDSDVRLVLDDNLSLEDEPLADVNVNDNDSDSDVRLVDEPLEDDVSEDVKFVDASSQDDVQPTVEPVNIDNGGSDSDVKLVVASDDLPAIDETMIEEPRPAIELESTEAGEDGSGVALEAVPGSGVSLEAVPGSGVSLEAAAESGISLEAVDESGISLEAADDESGLSLEMADESGIALDVPESGITLADDAESGISLAASSDSGISLDLGDGDDLAPPVPVAVPGDLDETQFEVPTLEEDTNGFEMSGASDGDTGTDTSVMMFEDGDDVDDYTDTVIKKSDDIDLLDDFVDMDDDDGDLDVQDDDLYTGDDGLDDLEPYDGDEVFDDEEELNYSPMPTVAAMPVEHEWGVGAFLPLLFSSLIMIPCGIVLFELVQSVWYAAEPGMFSGTLINFLGNLFGS